MTIFVKKDVEAMAIAVVRQFNSLQQQVLSGTHIHRDRTSLPAGGYTAPSSSLLQVGSVDATDLPSSLTLVNELRGVMMVHFADAESHLFADTYGTGGFSMVNGQSFITGAKDLPTAFGTLSFLSGAFGHVTGTVCHLRADVRPLTSSLVGTQGSVNNMANELKSKLNAHILQGPTVERIKLFV